MYSNRGIDAYKKLLIAETNYLIDPNDITAKILLEANNAYIKTFKPLCFELGNENNVFIRHRNSFEQSITALEEAGILQPRKLTVYQYLNKIKFFEKRNESLKPK